MGFHLGNNLLFYKPRNKTCHYNYIYSKDFNI